MKRWTRQLGGGMAVLAVVVALALCLPVIAVANETPPIALSAAARGYYYISGTSNLHFLDGYVTNDSSVTVSVSKVRMAWVENPSVVTEIWVGEKLAPGQWASFHAEWPSEAAASWTPAGVAGLAYPADTSALPLALTLNSVGPMYAMDGMRCYDANVTNNTGVTVSSIDLIGRETSGLAFVDSLFSWDVPDQLAPGATAVIRVRGKASDAPASVAAEMRFTAREKPTITLTPNTLSPAYGTPITFRIDLKRSNGTPATGWRTLKIYHSFDGQDWESDYFHQDTETGSVTTMITPTRPTYYRAVYWGGDDLGEVKSEWMLATPKIANAAPYAPSTARVYRSFKVYGRLNAGPKPMGSSVTVMADKKVGTRWVRKFKVTTAVGSTGGYGKWIKMSSRGTWRVRAYRYGVGYSKYRTVSVR